MSLLLLLDNQVDAKVPWIRLSTASSLRRPLVLVSGGITEAATSVGLIKALGIFDEELMEAGISYSNSLVLIDGQLQVVPIGDGFY